MEDQVKQLSWLPSSPAGLTKWKTVSDLIFYHWSLNSTHCEFTEAIYKEKLLLPTAPRAARGADVDESKIPSSAPYTAYIANLPYDIEVEDVSKFFHGLRVSSAIHLSLSETRNNLTLGTCFTGKIC